MTPVRSSRILETFRAALGCDPSARAGLLDRLCGDDAGLRAEVEKLLADDERANRDQFLKPPELREGGAGGKRHSPFPFQGLDVHIRCPHCRNPIELVGLPAGEVLCPSCGSTFRLETGSTATWGPSGGQRRLGRFELIESVGTGAFGTVYKARDPQLDRVVALKVPRAGNLPSGEERDRFLREARSVAQLRHPGIVPAHEVGEHEGVSYLVSDFVQGLTLADYLSGRRPTLKEAARLVAEVADALQYAHEHGVVHRDVKPSNILLDDAGRPHVTDFGLARREAGEVTMTIDGQVLGTPAYMSPEQARGEGHRVDGRGDVYSLGVVLYELLTGELPFRGNTRMLLHQVLHDEPRAPRSLNDRIPRDLETVCLKAMAKEPPRRFATARNLADDLRRWLDGQPIQARPVGPVERTWRWCRRHPLLALTDAALALALLAVAAVSIAFAVQQSRAAYNMSKEQGKTKDALVKAKAERDTARSERDKARRLATTLSLRQGQAFDTGDDSASGLLWMARAMRQAPADDAGLQHLIRTNLAACRWRNIDLRTIIDSSNVVMAVAFSPDGQTILTGSVDGTARLWDAAAGSPIGQALKQGDGFVTTAAFSADGKTVLTGVAGGKEGIARLWNVADGSPVGQPLKPQPTDGPVGFVAISPDGKTVLTCNAIGPGGRARIWSMADGTPVGQPLENGGTIHVAAFSPDGKTVLTGSGDGRARLWSVSDGSPIGQPLNHGGDIRAAAFSPDGKTVLTGSGDGRARLWSVSDGSPIGQPLNHGGDIRAAAFSPDGKTVLTANLLGSARLWSVADGSPIGQAMRHGNAVWAAAFSADGRTILTGSFDRTARLWSVADGSPKGQSLGVHQDHANNVVFSPDGRIILMGSGDGTARLWSVADGSPIGRPLVLGDTFGPVAFSPDGQTILTGARLWRAADGSPIGQVMNHEGTVMDVAFSHDGKAVLTGSADGMARLWSAADGSPIGRPLQHGGFVLKVAFSPDGQTVLTGGDNGVAQLWRVADGSPIGQRMEHGGIVMDVAFSPDGKSVLTGSNHGTARLWRAADGTPVGQPLKHQYLVTVVAFSPDGRNILTCSGDGTARLWSAVDGTPIGHAMEHVNAATAVAFSPDGQTILTGSEEGLARLWSAADGSPIGQAMTHGQPLMAVAFSADGHTILSGARDGTARLWPAPLPIPGEPERIELWAQVITGIELDELGVIRSLDAKIWAERRRRLRELGGPPTR